VRQKDELKQKEQERVLCERDVSAKVFSCLSVKALVAKAKESAFEEMDKSGVFYDPDLKMVEEDFMPWLYNAVDEGFKEVIEAQELVDGELSRFPSAPPQFNVRTLSQSFCSRVRSLRDDHGIFTAATNRAK
jgi:hypothetical protein